MGVGEALPSSISPFLLTQSFCWVSPLETLFSFPPQFGPCRYNWISRFSLSKAGFSRYCCTGQKRKREEIDATISKLRFFFFFFLMFWCGFPCWPLLRPPSRWWWPPPASLLPLLHLWLSCGVLTCGLSQGCPIRLFLEGRGWLVNSSHQHACFLHLCVSPSFLAHPGRQNLMEGKRRQVRFGN